MTTQWYLDMASRLDSVTSDLRNGNPVKHYDKLKKLNTAKAVMESTYYVVNLFGQTKESREAQEKSLSLLELAKTLIIKRYNTIHS